METKTLDDLFIEYVTSLGFVGKEDSPFYRRECRDGHTIVVSLTEGLLVVRIEVSNEDDDISYIYDGIIVESMEEIKMLFERSVTMYSYIFRLSRM